MAVAASTGKPVASITVSHKTADLKPRPCIYADLSHHGGDSRTLKPVTDIAEFDSKLAEIARDFEIDTRECTSHTGLGGERNDRS